MRPIHFHVIPIYDWVEELFWKDARYRPLENFRRWSGRNRNRGAEVTLFVWRELLRAAMQILLLLALFSFYLSGLVVNHTVCAA